MRAEYTSGYAFDGDDDTLHPIAWYCGNSRYAFGDGGYGHSGPHRVGLKRANDWGLEDMLGNVAEWVWDRRDDYPTRAVTDPVGDTTGLTYTHRGGGYSDQNLELRAAARESAVRGEAWVGFRLVRTAP